MNTHTQPTPSPSQAPGGGRRGGPQRGGIGRGRGGRSSGSRRGRHRGTGSGGGGDEAAGKTQSGAPQQQSKAPRPRPTHFLALPLHDHPDLRTRIAAFQAALFTLEDTKSAPQATSNDPPQVLSKRNAKGKPMARISSIVQGLDSSIVIDPVRMHMTLGVMALEPEVEEQAVCPPDSNLGMRSGPSPSLPRSSSRQPATFTEVPPGDYQTPAPSVETDGSTPPPQVSSQHHPPPKGERKTVATALALLRSLQPQIREILGRSPCVKVPLEVMDVLKTEKIRSSKPSLPQGEDAEEEVQLQQQEGETRVGAGVLFVGPKKLQRGVVDEERQKLESICDLIHRTFKEAGYLTDQRPLKLHCTILNASHRKPMRRIPFCYSDILASAACDSIRARDEVHIGLPSATVDKGVEPREKSQSDIDLVGLDAGGSQPVPERDTLSLVQPPNKAHRGPLIVPPPLPINLGTYDVCEVQLWVMGSRGPDGGYISLGGVELG